MAKARRKKLSLKMSGENIQRYATKKGKKYQRSELSKVVTMAGWRGWLRNSCGWALVVSMLMVSVVYPRHSDAQKVKKRRMLTPCSQYNSFHSKGDLNCLACTDIWFDARNKTAKERAKIEVKEIMGRAGQLYPMNVSIVRLLPFTVTLRGLSRLQKPHAAVDTTS